MRNKTILIIDDDDELTGVLKTLLEGQGYTVQSAPDSEEGAAKARGHRPDLIILDVMMRTTGEGIEAAQRFKGDEELKSIPIIMLSAVQDETDFPFSPETDGEFLPVEKFLPKPVDPGELLREIRKLVG